MGLHYLKAMPAVLEAKAKLTAQNQLTIPAPIRKYLRLHGGSHVMFKYSKGTIILVPIEKKKPANRGDQTLRPFLDLLDKDIMKRPERIVRFPPALLSRARSLVAGVNVDLNAPLTGQD